MAGRRRRQTATAPSFGADGDPCAICSRRLRPDGSVTLPCGHRFCRACIRAAADEGPLRCPLCRRRCGAWLRREGPPHLDGRGGSESPPSSPELSQPPPLPAPPIAAPGEIRSEFERQLAHLKRERELSDRRQREESEKLIAELKERGEIQTPDSKPDRLARQQKEFYASATKPIYSYFPKTNGGPSHLFATPNRVQDPSPELIPSAGRCKRFFENFFIRKPPPPDVPKFPKESAIVSKLHLSSSISLARFASRAEPDEKSEDSLVQELCYFKPINPISFTRYDARLVRAITFKKPNPVNLRSSAPNLIDQEKNPVLKNSKLLVNRKSHERSAFVPLSSTSNIKSFNGEKEENLSNDYTSAENFSTPKKVKSKKATPRKNSKLSKSCSKLTENPTELRFSKRIKRFSLNDGEKEGLKNNFQHTNGRNGSTISIKQKLLNGGKSENKNHKVLNGFHRRHEPTSNGDGCGNKCNGRPNGKVLRSATEKNGRNLINGNIGIDLDPSIVAEQKRIEEMINQEKNDFALAKKLQRQLNGTVFTGYTVRTAGKRQSTLTEILPPSKHMKI